MDVRIKIDVSSELLTHSNVADFIKFDDPGNADEQLLINNICKTVRANFEKRTGLSFIEKTYEVFFKYDDMPYIIPVSPIISIESVKTIDYEGTETALVLNSSYWKRGKYEIEIITQGMSTITNPFMASQTKYDLLVECKAGYGHDDTEDLPEDLKHAMKMQILQWYDNRDDFYEGVLLHSVDRILNSYKIRLI